MAAVPKLKNSKAEATETRAQQFLRRHGKPHTMPPLGVFEYLARHWENLGRCTSNGFGRAPFSWLELESWARITANYLTPWEFEAIMAMSRAYVSMSYEAEDINCQAPYLMELGKIDRAAVSEGIRKAFMGMVNEGKNVRR